MWPPHRLELHQPLSNGSLVVHVPVHDPKEEMTRLPLDSLNWSMGSSQWRNRSTCALSDQIAGHQQHKREKSANYWRHNTPTQEQGSQDTELLMKQNTLNPRLFLAVWPVVNRWIREGLKAEADRRGSRSILRRCWLVWAQDILPPPLVFSSDSEVGLWRGTPRRPRAGGLGDSSPSSSDSESDAHGVSEQMHPAEIVIMKCFRSYML